ncbi:hypothetical protein ACHAWF_010526 [Thalassiosira exigua]
MPELKSFLKDGEAESYRGVEVKFVPGRKAIMTVFEGGDDDDVERGEGGGWAEKEKVTLSDYKTKEEMHALMVEKGFVLRTEDELAAWNAGKESREAAQKAEKEAERKRRAEERRKEEARKSAGEIAEEEAERSRRAIDAMMEGRRRVAREEAADREEEAPVANDEL